MTDAPRDPIEAPATLDELWADMLLDACASDGPIRDNDVRQAMKHGRPKIEAVARDEGRQEAVLLLPEVLHDALPCRWKAHAGFTAKTDREYHEQQALHIARALARHGRSSDPEPAPLMPPQHCECGRELPCFDHRAVPALQATPSDPERAWHATRCPVCDRDSGHEEGCRYVKPEHRAALQATGEPADE